MLIWLSLRCHPALISGVVILIYWIPSIKIKACLRSIPHPWALPLLPSHLNGGSIGIILCLIENTLNEFSEVQLLSHLVNVLFVHIVVKASLVITKRRKYTVPRVLINVRAYALILAGHAAIHSIPATSLCCRRLAQAPVIHQSSIVLSMLILNPSWFVLCDLVLHVALDDCVLERLCIYLWAVLHQLEIIPGHYDPSNSGNGWHLLFGSPSHHDYPHDLVHISWRRSEHQWLRGLLGGAATAAVGVRCSMIDAWLMQVGRWGVRVRGRRMLIGRGHLFYLYYI